MNKSFKPNLNVALAQCPIDWFVGRVLMVRPCL